MAGGPASLENEPALTPVGGQEARRCEILRQLTMAGGGNSLLSVSHERVEDTLAQVAQVRRAPSKIGVLCSLVVFDQCVHHPAPSSVGGLASLDAGKRGALISSSSSNATWNASIAADSSSATC